MTSKSDKEKKSTGKTNAVPGKDTAKKDSPKPKKQTEEEDDDDLEEDDEMETTTAAKKGGKPASTSKKKGHGEEDDDEDGEDPVDDWDKVEEEEEWDPDFEEFDLPKSKGKKSGGGSAGKKGEYEEEDFKFDDEFKDMNLFNDNEYDDEEEDF